MRNTRKGILGEEAVSRIQRTFQIEAASNIKRDQKWIDEAIVSGPETPLTKKDMKAIRGRVLRGQEMR